MTPLEKALRRSITIKGKDYVVTLTPSALKITLKGHRIGLELPWEELVSGERALAVALQASVGQFEADAGAARRQLPAKSTVKKTRRR